VTATSNVRGRPPTRKGAPRGEHEVRASLIGAAIELFAERGPSAVSVRQIAEAAGVNHGLVHHYFGSKDGLITAVLDLLSTEATAEIAAHAPSAVIYASGGPSELHGRILAHLLLEGADPRALQTDFPAVHHLIAQFRAAGLGARAAKERAAQVAAMVLGWQLFEPFLTTAAGLDISDKTRKRLLDDAVIRLLRVER